MLLSPEGLWLGLVFEKRKAHSANPRPSERFSHRIGGSRGGRKKRSLLSWRASGSSPSPRGLTCKADPDPKNRLLLVGIVNRCLENVGLSLRESTFLVFLREKKTTWECHPVLRPFCPKPRTLQKVHPSGELVFDARAGSCGTGHWPLRKRAATCDGSKAMPVIFALFQTTINQRPRPLKRGAILWQSFWTGTVYESPKVATWQEPSPLRSGHSEPSSPTAASLCD